MYHGKVAWEMKKKYLKKHNLPMKKSNVSMNSIGCHKLTKINKEDRNVPEVLVLIAVLWAFVQLGGGFEALLQAGLVDEHRFRQSLTDKSRGRLGLIQAVLPLQLPRLATSNLLLSSNPWPAHRLVHCLLFLCLFLSCPCHDLCSSR